LQYFELVFVQLQLVQILCKLIIILVNYDKKTKGVLFMKHLAELSTEDSFIGAPYINGRQYSTESSDSDNLSCLILKTIIYH